MERWRRIKGYENYLISNQGRVFHPKSDRFVKLRKNTKDGYLYVDLYKNDDIKIFAVHKLVAKDFIGIAKKKVPIKHLDGCKTNNHVYNLEWDTDKENIRYAMDIGLTKSKIDTKNGRSKLTRDRVLEIRRLHEIGEYTQRALGKIFDVSERNISHIVNGKRWKHVFNEREDYERRMAEN